MGDDHPTHGSPSSGRPEQSESPGLTGRDLVGLGGLLVGGVVFGLVVGLLVDEAAGTDPLFTIVGIFLGILAAVGGFVVRARAALRP